MPRLMLHLVICSIIIVFCLSCHLYNLRRCEESAVSLKALKDSAEDRIRIHSTNILICADQQRRADAKRELESYTSRMTDVFAVRKKEFRARVEKELMLVRQESCDLDRKVKNSISAGVAFNNGVVQVGRLGLTKAWVEKTPDDLIQVGFDFNHVKENIIARIQLFDQCGICMCDVEKKVSAKYERNKDLIINGAIVFAADFIEAWAKAQAGQGPNNPYTDDQFAPKKCDKEKPRVVRQAAKDAAIKTTGRIGAIVSEHYTRKFGEMICDESGVSVLEVQQIDSQKIPFWPPTYMRVYVGIE